MSIELLKNLLLWATIINTICLALYFVFFVVARDFMYRVHSKWFAIPNENFDTIHYTLMAIYKVIIVAFNFIPLVALSIVA